MAKLAFGRYDYAVCLVFAVYAACSIVVPICLVPLAADLAFPLEDGGMTKGGTLQLARSIPMVAALVLCGFAAGVWGKRKALGFSVILMGAGIVVCSLAPTYGVAFLALCLTGLGEGVIEGLASPFVQALHPRESGRYLNLTHSFWSVGVVALVLAAGALLQAGANWRLIIGVCGALSLVPALFLLLPDHSPANPDRLEEKAHWREVVANTSAVVRQRRFWLYFAAMFFAGGAEFCLTFWCASFIQLAYNGSAWAAGIGTAVFSTGMIAGRVGAGLLVRQQHLQRLIVGMAVFGTAVCLFLPFLRSLTALYPLLFLAGVASGPFWPSLHSHGCRRTPGDATIIMILLSCAGVPGCGFFTLLMGILGDWAGLRVSFLLVPCCLLAVVGLVCADWRREKP